MTDNEIIKALECCRYSLGIMCKKCPSKTTLQGLGCRNKLSIATLDLINRQKAEIERLKAENKILSKNADTAFQDGLNEAQDLYAAQIQGKIKSEAIKEFAERLKMKVEDGELYDTTDDYIMTVEHIDNLVKEMEVSE